MRPRFEKWRFSEKFFRFFTSLRLRGVRRTTVIGSLGIGFASHKLQTQTELEPPTVSTRIRALKIKGANNAESKTIHQTLHRGGSARNCSRSWISAERLSHIAVTGCPNSGFALPSSKPNTQLLQSVENGAITHEDSSTEYSSRLKNLQLACFVAIRISDLSNDHRLITVRSSSLVTRQSMGL